jgi:signal transduction histidine kinase
MVRKRAERTQTDRSLRAERKKTDREATARRTAAEGEADEVLATARRDADAVLRLARARADDLLDRGGGSARARRQVTQERARHDRKVARERAAAATKLERERRGRSRAFAKRVAAERQQTDDSLLSERTRSDKDISDRDDALAVASHDLRGLAGAIALGAEALLQVPEVDEEVTQTAQAIQAAASQMIALVSNVMDAVGIEAGLVTLHRQRHPVGPLLHELLTTYRPMASEKGVHLSVSLGKDVPSVLLDRPRIVQALSNLVANAVKFTDPGGHVTLGADRTAGGVRFSVQDDGCGIPSGVQAAIFGRFKQGRRRDGRGLGLGLYIAKTIVDAHGSSISVDSAQGAGSTFQFTLPATNARARTKRPRGA